MTLQSSGTITANQINVELGRSGTAYFNLNGADERALADRPTNASSISFNHFYGKSARKATITTVGQLANGQGFHPRIGYGANARNNYYHYEGGGISSAAFGSIDKTTGLITSATLYGIYVVQYSSDYHLDIIASRSSNGGWTSVKLYRQGATGTQYTFTRSSASKFAAINTIGTPSVSNGASSYRWTFTDFTGGASSQNSYYHVASHSTSTMSAVHAMFEYARANNLDIYAEFS